MKKNKLWYLLIAAMLSLGVASFAACGTTPAGESNGSGSSSESGSSSSGGGSSDSADSSSSSSSGEEITSTNFTATALSENLYITYNYTLEDWGNSLDTADIAWENFVSLQNDSGALSVGGDGGVSVTADADELNGEDVTFTFSYGDESQDLVFDVWYAISNELHFNEMSNDLSARYLIVSDFTMEGYATLQGEFTGVLNGNFRTVDNLKVSAEQRNVALFSANRGTIQNLVVKNGVGYGFGVVAMLACENYGTISDCYVEMSSKGVYVDGSHGGGLVYDNGSGGVVERSVFIGTVDGEGTLGGVVGYGEAGWIGNNVFLATGTSGATAVIGVIDGSSDVNNATSYDKETSVLHETVKAMLEEYLAAKEAA